MNPDQAIAEPKENSVELPEPLRFDIKSLMILTAVCAVSVVIVDQLHLIGTVILFIVSALASIHMKAKESSSTSRFWFQATWGILMPLACLVTDPFIFVDGIYQQSIFNADNLSRIPRSSFFFFSFILTQMTVLVASWFITADQPQLAAFLAGSLWAGVIFAAVLGAILFIPAVVFTLIFLSGLPGFTPLLTAKVFLSAHRYCKTAAESKSNGGKDYGLKALGLIASVGIGFVGYAVWPLLVGA